MHHDCVAVDHYGKFSCSVTQSAKDCHESDIECNKVDHADDRVTAASSVPTSADSYVLTGDEHHFLRMLQSEDDTDYENVGNVTE